MKKRHPLETALEPLSINEIKEKSQEITLSMAKVDHHNNPPCPIKNESPESNHCPYYILNDVYIEGDTIRISCGDLAAIDLEKRIKSKENEELTCIQCRFRSMAILMLQQKYNEPIENITSKNTEKILIEIESEVSTKSLKRILKIKEEIIKKIPLSLRQILFYILGY